MPTEKNAFMCECVCVCEDECVALFGTTIKIASFNKESVFERI